jgi:hypothetical protein
MRPAIFAKMIDGLWRVLADLHAFVFFAVKNAQRIDLEPFFAVYAELLALGFEIAHQKISILLAASGTADAVQMHRHVLDSELEYDPPSHLDHLRVNNRVLFAKSLASELKKFSKTAFLRTIISIARTDIEKFDGL